MKNIIFVLLVIGTVSPALGQTFFKIQNTDVIQTGSYVVLKESHLHNQGNFTAFGGTMSIKQSSNNANLELGGSGFTMFNHLDIDLATADVQLLGNISVIRNLQFIMGNVDLNGNDLNLGSAVGTIIGEKESSSFYSTSDGEIIKVLNLNAPNFLNPGNIGVEITSDADMGATIIKRGHVAQSINGNPSIKRYYDISVNNNSGLDASVKFHYLNKELNGIDEMVLTPFRYEAPDWALHQVSDNDENENWVETMNLDAFSIWTLADASSLPVELTYFQAKKIGNSKVRLLWETATEVNNSHFEVERSKDGSHFELLQTVKGQGTSTNTRTYFIDDSTPFSGFNYYRLKQVDFDGSFEYSKIRMVSFDSSFNRIDIFPNPCSEYLNIQLEQAYKNGKLQLFDNAGKLVLSKFIGEKTQMHLAIGHIAKGSYVLQIEGDGEIFSEFIVIQ